MPLALKGQRSRLNLGHIPAPIGGINTVSPGVEMPKSDCIYAWNVIGAEYGLRPRLGWREWCTGLNGEQVRSLLPFTGSTKSGSNNRLFAATTSGIWDVSASSATPTQVVTFGVQNADSGYGASTVMVTAAGHFLCYCDEANGYYVYTESTATWTQGGLGGNPVTGVDPATLVFVLAWKNRLWFVEGDSGRAWYLGIGAVTGAATSFTFGNRFKYGGDLRCLANWSYDGGTGMDDSLVAVSGGGDLVIYQGTDPASAATFALQGVWYVGGVPVGRRLTTDIGGDVLVMSSLGLVPLSKLVTGLVLYDRSQYRTAKIANLFNQVMAATSTLPGWAMRVHPQDNALVVLVPTAVNQAAEPMVMSLSTQGWSRYRDMPIGVCAEPWGGDFYFGTQDGRVCIAYGYVDGVTLATPTTGYTPIDCSLLTAYTNLGSPSMKRVKTIAVTTVSQGGNVSMNVRAKYKWDTTEIDRPTATATAGASSWDSGLWDSALWGGSYTPQRQVFGAYGMGPEAAIGLRWASSSRMSLTGIDVSFETGGPL